MKWHTDPGRTRQNADYESHRVQTKLASERLALLLPSTRNLFSSLSVQRWYQNTHFRADHQLILCVGTKSHCQIFLWCCRVAHERTPGSVPRICGIYSPHVGSHSTIPSKGSQTSSLSDAITSAWNCIEHAELNTEQDSLLVCHLVGDKCRHAILLLKLSYESGVPALWWGVFRTQIVQTRVR